jgi:hypothetical protein
VKSHVAIGRKPLGEGKSEVFLMISNAQHKQGLKYLLLDNVETVFTRLLHEGRTTIRLSYLSSVFRIRIRIETGQWILFRIRIDPGGKKLPTKLTKV